MIPIEWLRTLREQGRYELLLEEAGGLAGAAWQLAKIKCQVWKTPSAVPTRAEVRAAAREIVSRVQRPLRVPTSRQLAIECEMAGLLVI